MKGGRGAAPRVEGSIIDRLIDARPDRDHDAHAASGITMAELRSSVRRDLEHLLNARRPWRTPPLETLHSSPLGYGLVDLASGAVNEPRARDALRDGIMDTIRRFEPRLARVSVEFVGGEAALRSTLRLRIGALLLVEPSPEAISFDTTFEASTSDFVIQPGGGA